MPVSRLKAGVIILTAATLFLGVALIASLRKLSVARSELQSIEKANLFLRQTLGDLTVTVTIKDEEIDRLTNSACVAPQMRQFPLQRPKTAPQERHDIKDSSRR